jgi:hypothetical protein
MAAARDTNRMALHNLLSNVDIELTSATDLLEIAAKLDVNTSLQEAELRFDTSFAGRAQHDILRLLQSLCRRPNLRHLKLKSNSVEQPSFYTLDLRVLANVLDTSLGLQTILLGDIQMSGNPDDFRSLEESILRHTSLQEVTCTSWLSEQTRVSIAASVDPMLRAFASSRSLKSLAAQPTFFGGDVCSVTAGMLCTMPRLQSLNLSKCHFSDRSMVALATALKGNSVLKELRLTCQLEEAGCNAVAECLAHNDTLELLCIHNTYINKPIDASTIDINETKSGPSGDTYDSDETTVDDDHYLPIAQALQMSNRSLRNLFLHGTRLCKSSQEAFVETMRHNYSLLSVDLLGLGDSVKAKIDTFTLLNRCGRLSLMLSGGTNRGRWIDVMAQVAGDLDCMFYLLSTKPSLCDLVKNSEAATAVAGKRQLEKVLHDPSMKRSRSS